MPTNTSGGTTVSLDNTPQAVDDCFAASEDQIYCFDVMANDLGGNAKTLWSIDNTSDDGSADLITKDVAGCSEFSELGARIWITAGGKIAYDSSASSQLASLAEGQTAVDQFTYAIRMSNGTLSWATVSIEVTGTNDAVTIVAANTTASGAVVEDSAATPSPTDSNLATGSIAFTDPDLADSHTASAAAAAANTTALGSFALDPVSELANAAGGSVGWSYTINEAAAQYLAAGQSVIEVYTVTIDDGHGATVTQDVTVTITGTNDAPVVAATDVTGGVTELVSPVGDLTDTGTIAFSDVDLTDAHSVSPVTPSAGALGALTASVTTDTTGSGTGGVVSWSYTVPASAVEYLAADETRVETFTFNLLDGNGGSIERTVTVTITGTNDAPVVQGVAVSADEDGASVTASFNGDDIDSDDDAASLTYAITSDPSEGSVVDNGDGTFTFDPGADFQDLAEGETREVSFTYTATDSHGAVSSSGTVTVTVTGTNDAPVVQDVAVAADEDGAAVTASFNGDDIDTDDDGASLVYNITSDPSEGSVVNNDDGTLTFDPGSDFQDLAEGETRQVTFGYTATDSHSSVSNSGTVTVTVTGTNDAPVVSGAVLATVDEDDANPATVNLLANASDPDLSDDLDVASVDYSVTGGAWAAAVAYSVDPETGALTFDPGQFNALAVSESIELTFTYNVIDGNGGVTPASAVITITGSNDSPDIHVVTTDTASATLVETNAGLATAGTLTVNDPDASDVVSSSVTAVVASGTTVGLGLTNAQLLAMLAVTPTSGLAANPADAHNLGWNFNSGSEAFNYLGAGQSLILTYTVTSLDGNGGSDTHDVTITIDGTADGVTIPPVFNDGGDLNDFDALVGTSAPSFIVVNGTNIGETLTGDTSSNDKDIINGLGGDDIIHAGDATDQVYGGTGNDVINGGDNSDLLYGQAGIDTIHGDQISDDIYGGSDNDNLFGDAGNDFISGGSGSDSIDAGDDNDTLIGGYGADTLFGGIGTDTFKYLSLLDTGDTITDFTGAGVAGGDLVDFSAIDANGAAAGDPAFLWGGTTATAFGAWYSVSGANSTVYIDTDGNTATAELAITLLGVTALTTGDFTL